MDKSLPQIASLEEEEEAINALKIRLDQDNVTLPEDMVFAGDTDATLLRFIRARKLNIDDTAKMISDCVRWRQEAGVRQLLISPMSQDKMEVIRRYRPSSYVGFDKQGRPVFVDRPGIINYDKIWAAGLTDDDILRFHISEMEYMGRILLTQASKLKGHTVDSVTVIMDMSGLSMRHFTKQSRELFKQILKTDSDNYPETNAGTYIVNVSWVFQTVWKFVSSIIDARTAAKIQVLGSKSSALPILQQVIDLSVIPDFLGGNNEFDACREEWAVRMDREISTFASAQPADTDRTAPSVEPPVAPKSHKSSPLATLRRSLSGGKRAPGRSKSDMHVRDSPRKSWSHSDTGGDSDTEVEAKRKRRSWFGSRRSIRKSSSNVSEVSDAERDVQSSAKLASAGQVVPVTQHDGNFDRPLPPDSSGIPHRALTHRPKPLEIDDDTDAASTADSDNMDPVVINAISRIDKLIEKVKRAKEGSTGKGGLTIPSHMSRTSTDTRGPRIRSSEAEERDEREGYAAAPRRNSTGTPEQAASDADDELCYGAARSGSPGGGPGDDVPNGKGVNGTEMAYGVRDMKQQKGCGCVVQ